MNIDIEPKNYQAAIKTLGINVSATKPDIDLTYVFRYLLRENGGYLLRENGAKLAKG